MNDKALYEQKNFLTSLRLFKNRIEMVSIGLKQVIPISDVATVEKMPLLNQINLKTNDGRRIAVYPKRVNEFLDLIYGLIK